MFLPVSFAQQVEIPNFWDKHERFTKPDLTTVPRLRFLTTTDFPPFNFIDRKKRLTGFHVDLARAICAELELLNRCEIQALPWGELEKAVKDGEGEAIIAGLAVTDKTRDLYDFTRPYFRIPGRFVVRSDSGFSAPAYDALFRGKVGVIKGSTHAAYFKQAFANRTAVDFANREVALQALKSGEVNAVFSDGLSLSFWLTSQASADCCSFLDGPFDSRKFFGNGFSIAVAKNKGPLVDGMNYALSRINSAGTFSELYLRYFPVGIY